MSSVSSVWRHKSLLVKLLFVAVIVGVGQWVSNPYYLQLLTFIGINTLLALGLNMVMGYAGQISLGHAAFYGLGAYTSALLTIHLDWSPWLALPITLVFTAVTAFLVALPMLRLSGYYLGMGTLAFGMIGFSVFLQWRTLTGGDSGLVGIPLLTLGPISFDYGSSPVYLVWGVVFLSFWVCERIIGSRIGRALRALHDSERAAAAMGIDTSRLKVQVFVFSAVLAAMAGFLYAHLVTFISPHTFDFLMSIKIVTMVVIGGMASVWGALLGASLLTLLPEWLHVFSDYEMIIYGLILVVIMIFMPQGLTRGLIDSYAHLKSRAKTFHKGHDR